MAAGHVGWSIAKPNSGASDDCTRIDVGMLAECERDKDLGPFAVLDFLVGEAGKVRVRTILDLGAGKVWRVGESRK